MTENPLTQALSYARRLIEEAEAYQVSNADCDWDDVEGMEFVEDIDADQWNDATCRERLWDIGAGDTGLDSLLTEVNVAYGLAGSLDDGALDRLQTACWVLWDYLVADYGHEVDTPDDLAAPPFPRLPL
jgi:hypothetical protein